MVYDYDGLQRLTSADVSENNVLTQSYTYSYDLMGNRLSANFYRPSLGDLTAQYTYNKGNQPNCRSESTFILAVDNDKYSLVNLHKLIRNNHPLLRTIACFAPVLQRSFCAF